MGQILNSRRESCVCWLLSLKCQACQMDSKQLLLILLGKMVVEINGVGGPVVSYIFLSDLSHQNY